MRQHPAARQLGWSSPRSDLDTILRDASASCVERARRRVTATRFLKHSAAEAAAAPTAIRDAATAARG